MIYDRSGMATRIRKRRKELNMSADDVAQRIGRTPRYYGDIERGTCGMSVETLTDISTCLGITADYILFGSCEESRDDAIRRFYKIIKSYDARVQKKVIELLEFYLEHMVQ